MRVIALSTLKAFWLRSSRYRDAEGPTLAWYRDVLKADWAKPSEVKGQFGSASILMDGRVVFNIGGNKYRIVVWINVSVRSGHVDRAYAARRMAGISEARFQGSSSWTRLTGWSGSRSNK